MAKRNNKGQFVKGQSGNPGGMTKETVARRRRMRDALENAVTDEEIAGILVEGARGLDATCLRLLTDYKWGKPKPMADEKEDDDLEDLSDDQLHDLVREAYLSAESKN